MISTVKNFLSSPAQSFGFVLFICILALGAAFASEGFLGLEPCILCIYQRYPYAIAASLSFFGLALRRKKNMIVALYSLCSLSFLANSVIAFYHTGVERHWWRSFIEECTMSFDKAVGQNFFDNIMSAPAAACDQIPWADPILGLSMANYNVMLCFGLFVFCLICAALQYRKKH